jgi:gamma-glutamylcyclotransferase (GGCT)/AIG2-like uncharacterized protein YtfP
MNNKAIFVYGTLKRGFVRHYALRDQRYLGTAKTEKKYGMYAISGYPAMVDESAAAKSGVDSNNEIIGELYEVDDECIQELDKIEGVIQGLFERKDVALNEITFVGLPTNEHVWKNLNKKIAQSYFFERNLNGAADCGSLWTQK